MDGCARREPDQRLTASDGTPFTIAYSATAVTVTAVGATAKGTHYDWLESEGLVAPGGDYEAADLDDVDATPPENTIAVPASGPSPREFYRVVVERK